nr:hypothetical protein [uncultured Campylobacter sp.]
MTILQESNARAKLIRCLAKAYSDYLKCLVKAKDLGIDDNLVKRIQTEVAEKFSSAKPKSNKA